MPIPSRLLPAVLLALSGCAPAPGLVETCAVDGDCPVGARCAEGRCLPDELTPLPREDTGGGGGADAGDAADASGDAADATLDAGDDGGADAAADVPQGDVPLQDLTVAIEAPAEGDWVGGEVAVTLAATTDARLTLTRAKLFADGEPVAEAPGGGPVPWDTLGLEERSYTIVAAVTDSGGREATSEPVAVRVYNRRDLVQRVEGRFLVDGEPWGAVGVEYTPPVDAQELAGDVRAVAEAGFTTVEVPAPGGAYEVGENQFAVGECGRLQALLTVAGAAGVKVLLVLPWAADFPWLVDRMPGAASAFGWVHDGKVRSALARRHGNLVEHCGLVGRDELLGYDVVRGARAGDEAARHGEASIDAWESWTIATYGGAVPRERAWGAPADVTCGDEGNRLCPPDAEALCRPAAAGPAPRIVTDYRRFVRESTDAAVADLVARLRRVDPEHLVTVGHASAAMGGVAEYDALCASHGGYVDPRVGGASVDFTMVRARPWEGVTVAPGEPMPAGQEDHADDLVRLEWLMAWARRDDRPAVMGGFGYAGAGLERGEAIAAAVWAQALGRAAASGGSGAVGFRWRDEGAGDGVIGEQGAPTDVAATVADLAPPLAAPEPWEAEVRVLAPPGPYARFRDRVVEAIQPWRSAREGGRKAAVVDCGQVADLAACANVLGCPGVCTF